jgi:hypothetical protein
MHHITTHLRSNVVAYIALAVALGGGGGYALAATNTKTVTVCANEKTGAFYLHHRGRCKRGQTRITWNQKGPQGPQGATGPAGAPAVSVWAIVAGNGTVISGQGLSVQHVSAGTYHVTVTTAGCATGFNAPTVTVSDGNPPAGQSAGAFPEGWVGDTGTNEQFTVNTGVVTSGSFTATDHSFNVQDACS